jgi:uncharacterized protein YegL
MTTIHGFSLGDLGQLVDVNTTEEKCNSRLPQIIVVMDTSGSMGDYVSALLNGAIPDALETIGYHVDTPINVITFNSSANYIKPDPSLRKLRDSYNTAGGNTYLGGCFPLISLALDTCDVDHSVAIIAISDGEISDPNECLAQVRSLRHTGHAIQVIMLRLQTSSENKADTRALACIAKFGTDGKNNIFDIHGDIQQAGNEVVRVVTETLLINDTICIEGESLRRNPSMTSTKQIRVRTNEPVCLLVPNSTRSLRINNRIVPITMESDMPVSAIRFLCDYTQAQLNLDLVIGDSDLKMVHQWFAKLKERVRTDENLLSERDLRARIAQLQQQTRKEISSRVNEVLELANNRKLTTLNSQQQADFLRSTANRSLAKRTFKECDPETIQRKLAIEVRALLDEIRSLKSIPKDQDPNQMSFYSSYNNYETFLALSTNLNVEDVVGDMQSMLRLFGLMGVAYESPCKDWVDPYRFEMGPIFGGSYLSTNDLREVQGTKIQEQRVVVRAPGYANSVITGVIPLRFLNPDLFDLVFKKCPLLMQIHASINMRCLISPVRNDLLGERIALLCHIMESNSALLLPIPAWHQQIFDDVRDQIRWLCREPINVDEFRELLFRLTERAEPLRSYLSGSNAISCVQKVLIAIAIKEEVVSSWNEIWNVLYEFDCYHRARHHFNDRQERDRALGTLFNIHVEDILAIAPVKEMDYIPTEQKDDDNHVTYRIQKLTELANEVAQKISINVPEAAVKASQLDWIPRVETYVGYNRFLGTGEVKIEAMDKLCFVVAAIHCACEQERLQNGESQTFQWNAMSKHSFLLRVVRSFYAGHYLQAANTELECRDDVDLAQAIAFMVSDQCDIVTFVQQLSCYVPSRSYKGYHILVQKCQDPIKLALLLTGRNLEEKESLVVWQDGNLDPDISLYRERFATEWWNRMVSEVFVATYRYRQCINPLTKEKEDLPNRHGSSNANPSEWAKVIYPQLVLRGLKK